MIGIGRESAGHASEAGLAAPILGRYMPAFGASAAGIVWCHHDQMRPAPGQLVVELTPELVPPLVEDRTVEAGLGPDVSTGLIDAASGRARHSAHLQVFQHHERVVLADRSGSLVQEVTPGMGDAGLEALDAHLGFLPVVTVFRLATQGLLRPAQCLLMHSEAVERG